jgi:hypothetical protein
MHGQVNVYIIWYGNVAVSHQSAIRTYLQSIGQTPYMAINTTYYDSNGPVSGQVALAGETTDTAIGLNSKVPYSLGNALTDSLIQQEVSNAIFSR